MPSTSKPSGSPAKRMHNRFDRTLKRIAEREPVSLLAWLAEILAWPPTTLIQANRSKELIGSEQEVDVLWLVETDGAQELLHWEFQLEKERRATGMGARMASYVLQLFERDELPVHPVVIYLKDQETPGSPFVIGTKHREYLRCNFDEIKLWLVDPETVLKRPSPYLWPLAGMMAKMSPQRVLMVAEQIVAAVEDKSEQRELVGMLVVLAGVQFSDAEIASALRRNGVIDEIWESSDTALAQRARGHAQGLAEGRAEMLRVALEARFGEVDQKIMEAVGAADEATVTALVKEMMAQPNLPLAEVRARLGLKPA